MRTLNLDSQRGHSPQIVLRVPASLLDRVARFADEEFCSRSVAVRMLIERGLSDDGQSISAVPGVGV
jgi:hypothetical protein